MTMEMNEVEILEAIKSGKKLVVKMWMDGCSFCDQYKPIFDKVAAENNDAVFISFNMPANVGKSEFKDKYMVPGPGEKLSAPCTYLFENGQMTNRHFGLINPLQLQAFINGVPLKDAKKEALADEYISVLARKGELTYLVESYQREMPQLDAKIYELRKALGIGLSN